MNCTTAQSLLLCHDFKNTHRHKIIVFIAFCHACVILGGFYNIFVIYITLTLYFLGLAVTCSIFTLTAVSVIVIWPLNGQDH